jgi:hypothetical protein
LRLNKKGGLSGLALETLPSDRAGEFYEEATRGRSASHHLQVKAALALIYDVQGKSSGATKVLAHAGLFLLSSDFYGTLERRIFMSMSPTS